MICFVDQDEDLYFCPSSIKKKTKNVTCVTELFLKLTERTGMNTCIVQSDYISPAMPRKSVVINDKYNCPIIT